MEHLILQINISSCLKKQSHEDLAAPILPMFVLFQLKESVLPVGTDNCKNFFFRVVTSEMHTAGDRWTPHVPEKWTFCRSLITQNVQYCINEVSLICVWTGKTRNVVFQALIFYITEIYSMIVYSRKVFLKLCKLHDKLISK